MNLAFKCTWNDAGFKGVCSRPAYDYNTSKNRVWCKKAMCQQFDGIPNEANHPCYESVLFTAWRFGAGWDHRTVDRPRVIRGAKAGNIALLTTQEPEREEKDRRIIGFMRIGGITQGEKQETVVFGDPSRSVEIDRSIELNFWHYYQNPNVPGAQRWGSGLFRYVSDDVIVEFLRDLRNIYAQRKFAAQELAKIEKELDEYKQHQSREVKEAGKVPAEKRCQDCGHLNLDKAKFCNNCGNYLRTQCGGCGTSNPHGSRYCCECGKPLGREVVGNGNAIRDRLLALDVKKLIEARGFLFTSNAEAEQLVLRDSNAFLFAVILDQGIGAERAWSMPCDLRNRLGHLDPTKIVGLSAEELEQAFSKPFKLHRFWKTMARRIKDASTLIIRKYEGRAENMWGNNPDSRTVYKRLLDFEGIGQKKASMTVNILFRDLDVKISDPSGIDVSYDVMVRRTFLRTGLVEKDTQQNITEAARALNPHYPGELDLPAWWVGRNWCLPDKPRCNDCRLNDQCPKVGV